MGIFRKIIRTPLFRITSLNGISVLVKIFIGFATSKILAIYVGPAGIALVGNFRNFITAAEGVSTLGFQNGIVKYVAQSREEPKILKKIISTIFICLIAVSIVLSIILYFLSGFWNELVFGENSVYAELFKFMAVAFPFYAASIFLISIINGLGQFRQVIYVNIAGNVMGLLASFFLIWKYDTFGALLSLVIAPALLFFITIYIISRRMNILNHFSFASFDWPTVKNLGSYSSMALVSAIFVPLVYLAIRQHATDISGLDSAGHWEAMNRISSYTLMFISTLLSVYFLPKLSLATGDAETKRVIRSYYRGVMPVFILGLLLTFTLKDYLIRGLFTSDFLPMSQLFGWQLCGDALKAASLILGFQFIARKLTVAYIITEVISLAILYFSSILFLHVFDIKGLAIAYCFTYLIYFSILVIYFRKQIAF